MLATAFQIASAMTAAAAGSSGGVVPGSVHAEGGRVYIFGAFSYPEQCATSSLVVLTPSNSKELKTMTSIAFAAVGAGRFISTWLIIAQPSHGLRPSRRP